MDLSNDNSQSMPHEATKLMIDKTTVISVLKKLIDEYPSETVPYDVVREALIKVMGASAVGDFIAHPAVQKLDQVLIKARSANSS